jgi:uncharacterized membrane protein (UPF0127 family)
MKRFIALFALACLCTGQAQALGRRAPAPFASLPRSELQVITAKGPHEFRVWIADNDQSRTQGLMFVKELPARQGMLFLFERPQFAAFWMKNTYLSLDIIFIAPDGVVVNVARGATPLSLRPIESAAPVMGVLELVSGTAEDIGLEAGDRIVHPAFAPKGLPPTEANSP